MALTRNFRQIPNQASSSGFDDVLTNATTALQASQNSFVSGGTKSSQILPLLDARTKAYKGLEQLVLKNLVENMIPKDSVPFSAPAPRVISGDHSWRINWQRRLEKLSILASFISQRRRLIHS
jgi:hypothetical protein